MQVILLENIRRLGSLGEVVDVKAGYGRNYLIPYKKAVSATKDNIAKFETLRAELEKQAAEKLAHAKARLEHIAEKVFTIAARAADEGRLYGSIGIREVVEALASQGTVVQKSEINLVEGPIRTLGEHKVNIVLYTDVECDITLNIVESK